MNFARNSAITALGAMNVIGASENKIEMVSAEPVKSPGDWRGVILYGDNSLVNNTVISHAVRGVSVFGRYTGISHSQLDQFSFEGVHVYPGATGDIRYNQFRGGSRTRTGLGISSSEVKVVHNTFSQLNDGIYISMSSPAIQGNVISDNNRGIYIQKLNTSEPVPSPVINNNNKIYANSYGIYLSARKQAGGDPNPVIHDNEIHDNTTYNLYQENFYPASIINAANNWWGTEVEADILAGFNDPYHVLYSPYREASGELVYSSSPIGVIAGSLELESGQTHVVDTMVLQNGASLAIGDGATLQFPDNTELVVQQGASVTIGAGARLEFGNGAQFVVDGELINHGTAANPVVFTKIASSTNWKGLYLNSPNLTLSDFVIEYASLEVVDGPVTITDGEISRCNVRCLYVGGALNNPIDATIHRLKVDGGGYVTGMYFYHVQGNVSGNEIANAYDGMLFRGVTRNFTAEKNTLRDNGRGIYLVGQNYYPNAPVLHFNNIYNSTDMNIRTTTYLDTEEVIDATNNWWGTAVDADIQAAIWDENDATTQYPVISYVPYRTSAVPMPPKLDPLPRFHSAGTLNITGQAEANSFIRVYVNNVESGAGSADGNGDFDIPVSLPAGENAIHVVAYSGATDSYPSRSYLVVRDVTAPVITITSPADGLLTNQYAMTITGWVSEPASLTIEGNPVTLSADNGFSYGPVYLDEGANSLTVVATDAAGNIATETLNLTLDSTPPSNPNMGLVSLSGPTAGIVTVTGLAGSVDNSTRVTIVNARTGRSVRQQANADGSFSMQLDGQTGDPIYVVSEDDLGNQSAWGDIKVPGISPSLNLNILSPSNGQLVNDNFIDIVGTVNGPPNIGVVARGVPATIIGNTFVVKQVYLDSGNNSIDVIASAPDGTSQTKTIAVTNNANAEFKVSTSPMGGIVNQPIKVSVESISDRLIDNVRFDMDGDGMDDVVQNLVYEPALPGVAEVASAEYTYATPGIYEIRVTISKTGGGLVTKYATIAVSTEIGLQSRVVQPWADMVDKLNARDIQGGLSNVMGTSRSYYENLFTIIGAALPIAVSELGEIESISVGEGYGELKLVRDVQGVKKVFFINVIRGEDGVWRIESM